MHVCWVKLSKVASKCPFCSGSDLADRDSDEDTTVEEEESLEQWVLIQKEAFTNWCNDKLKAKGVVIHDVKYDFR